MTRGLAKQQERRVGEAAVVPRTSLRVGPRCGESSGALVGRAKAGGGPSKCERVRGGVKEVSG